MTFTFLSLFHAMVTQHGPVLNLELGMVGGGGCAWCGFGSPCCAPHLFPFMSPACPSAGMFLPQLPAERPRGGEEVRRGGERSPAARRPEIDAACCVILQVKMSPAATRVRLVNSLSTAPGSSCSTHRTRTAYGST